MTKTFDGELVQINLLLLARLGLIGRTFFVATLIILLLGSEACALSLTFISAKVNGVAQSTINPISVNRGQRVTLEYDLRNSSGVLVTSGATVTVSHAQYDANSWLANTPEFVTNHQSNGRYRVEFYVPTLSGTTTNAGPAPFDRQLFPVVEASMAGEANTQTTAVIQVTPPSYGLTVLIHGYQLPAVSDCAEEGKAPPSDFVEIGQAIVKRAGKGRLWAFNYQSDTLKLLPIPDFQNPYSEAGTTGIGEDVVVVNWCDVSNNASPGHGEVDLLPT